MHMRQLGRTNLQVSEIGLGCEHLEGTAFETVDAVIGQALHHGINFLDVFMAEPKVRSDIGKALQGRRQNVVLQGHIGSTWQNGQYQRSRDLATCHDQFVDLMRRLNTDHVDIGMLHFCDQPQDWDKLVDQGIVEYVQKLKQDGTIRAIGLSSHEPLTALRAVQTGIIDVLMFSLNPAFDLLPQSLSIESLFDPATYAQDLLGVHPDRSKLHQACVEQGTAITVMKAYGGSHLLSKDMSPLGQPLTPVQCLHYALTRPGVSSVLAGCRTPQEVDAAARYAKASPEEKDFTQVLSESHRYAGKKQCLYCNHCLPCPVRIDIAQVLKLSDLAKAATQPATIKAHYQALSAKASDCTACGQCEARCPFEVPIIERLAKTVQELES